MVVALLGLTARGLLLGRVPLSGDEAFTGVLTRRSLAEMIDVVHNDNHTPLHYLLVRLAATLGNTPEVLRAPSVLAGAAAVPIAAALGRRLGGNSAGLVSGAVVALTPMLVLSGRDARMYSLAITMVLAMGLALWRAVEVPSAGRLGLYFATIAVALYAHYLTALAIPTQLAAALLLFRPALAVAARLVAAAAAGGLTLVPWLLYAAPQFRHAGEPYWSKPVSVPSAAAGLADLLAHPGPTSLVVVGGLAATAVVAAFGARAYGDARITERRGMLYVLTSSGLALAALFVISSRKPLIDQRFTNLYTTEPLAFAGAALARTGRKWMMGAALAALAATTLIEVATLQTPDVPYAISPLAGRVDPSRDVVALNGPHRYFQVLYYGDPATHTATRVVSTRVRWFEGLAGFRQGDIVPAVPVVTGTVYLVTDPGQRDPPMPPGMNLVSRRCGHGSCLETWTH
jgi:4-amino-4-deoxy-L-arabinose transferase-like glycosyltransferase